MKTKIFKSAAWWAFWPNFLAVILGIIVTFGVERLISNHIEQRNADEIVRKVKHDVQSKLSESEKWLSIWEGHIACLQNVFDAYDGYKFDVIHIDTLRMFSAIFFERIPYMYDTAIRDLITSSECLKTIKDKNVVESLTSICAIMPARWTTLSKLMDEVELISVRLRERMKYSDIDKIQTEEQYWKWMATLLMEDSMCWTAIYYNSLSYNVNAIRYFDDDLRKNIEILEVAGY